MRVGFLPAAPLLVPALSSSAPPDLVAACREVIAWLPEPIVVVGSAPTSGWYVGDTDLAAWGLRVPPVVNPLPPDLAVAASLCDGRLWGVSSSRSEVPSSSSLLVVGDGCATRATTGPGPFRDAAEAYDALVLQALQDGDPQGLLDLDAAEAADLWVGGLTAWQAVAASLQGASWTGDVLWHGTPFGVTYTVARWSRA